MSDTDRQRGELHGGTRMQLKQIYEMGHTMARRPHWQDGAYVEFINANEVRLVSPKGTIRHHDIDDLDMPDFQPYAGPTQCAGAVAMAEA